MYTNGDGIKRVSRVNGRLKFIHRAAQDLGVTPSYLRKWCNGKVSSHLLQRNVTLIHPELLAVKAQIIGEQE